MRGNITPIFKEAQYELYVEPFGGAGGMIFGKEPDPHEIYNDREKVLTNFFMQLRNPESVKTLEALCNITPTSRVFYYSLREIVRAYCNGDDVKLQEAIRDNNLESYPVPVVIAFAMFYVQNHEFGGKFPQWSYGGACKPAEYESAFSSLSQRYTNHYSNLQAYADRFKNINIENLDYLVCIEKYDSTKTLFYLDPPYESSVTTRLYAGWSRRDSENLIEAVSNAKASIVLSCYDNEAFEKLFDVGFQRKQFHANCSLKQYNDGTEERTETVYYRLHEKEKPKLLF